MQKWEYLRLVMPDAWNADRNQEWDAEQRTLTPPHSSWEQDHVIFNRLGEQGWELVAALTNPDDQGKSTYTFKRPME